jgi:hypothetical protein
VSVERQFLIKLLAKLRTCTYITSSANVIVGEMLEHSQLDNTMFPRLEILIAKSKENDYIDQRQIESEFRFSIAGWVRREKFNNLVTEDDTFYLLDFAYEVKRLVKSFNSDKVNGIIVCDGFTQVSAFAELFYEHEIIEKLDSFILMHGIEFTLPDTYGG